MSTSTSRAPVVTAVLVAHDGAPWLPEVLAGLAGQTRRPDVVVGVDVASRDDSRALMVRALGAGQVCVTGRDSGFGAAVQAGLDHARPPATGAVGDIEQQAGTEPATRAEWVWLLHDDSCPAADALRRLLEHAVAEPEPGVVGPKVRGWNDQRLLLEVGVTIARSGRRETGLERREHDQGQHDGRHRVLATGSAGMLVRRDVWDKLGGFDRALPLFRDDVDFGWRANLAGHRVFCVTDAVVHHAEAASHGRRRLTADVDRHHLVDRRNAIFVLLANLPLYRLPLSVPRLAAGSLLRAIGLLAGKLPGPALDELRAFAAVVVRPDRVVRARVARRRTRELPARAVNPLLAARWSGLRHLAETVAGLIGTRSPDAYGAGRHRVVESGPTSDEAEDLPGWGAGLVRRAMVRPAVLLVALLTVLTVVAWRALLGGGLLFGGALLPAGGGAHDLWRTYTEGWHPVGLGSDAVAPPYLAVLATLATLLFGSVGTAVTV
ncbi:MAG: hypothetical protein QOE01_1633, partial [Actinomycetota bacterium]|nr:hypothetical protein [Actinomycetota bacterium]